MIVFSVCVCVCVCRLVGLLEDDTSTVELVHEVVVTLGSFSHGLANNVSVILSTQALPLLINGGSINSWPARETFLIR